MTKEISGRWGWRGRDTKSVKGLFNQLLPSRRTQVVLKAWQGQRERARKSAVTSRWLSCSHFTLWVSTQRRTCTVFKSSGSDANRLCFGSWSQCSMTVWPEHGLLYVPEFQDHLKLQWNDSCQVLSTQGIPGREPQGAPAFEPVSHPRHYDLLNWMVLCCEAAPCITEQFTASLVSTHWMPSAALPVPTVTTKTISKCAAGGGEGKSPLVENRRFGWIPVLEDEGNSTLLLDICGICKPRL